MQAIGVGSSLNDVDRSPVQPPSIIFRLKSLKMLPHPSSPVIIDRVTIE